MSASSPVFVLASDRKRLIRVLVILWFAVIVVSISCGLFVDGPLAETLKAHYGNPFHLASRWLTDALKADFYFAAAIAGLVFGYWRRQKKIVQAAIYGLAALSVSGLLVQGFKHIIGRQRPYADSTLSARNFEFFVNNYEWHSMPSGHAQVAFTVATFLTLVWPRFWSLWLTLAVALTLTRVITLNHWLSDTIVGGAVGVTGALLAFLLMNRTRFCITD